MEATVAAIDPTTSIEMLYRQDGDRLWRAIYAFSGDTEVASDAVAEAFAQLLRRGTEVRHPAAWAWRAACKIARGVLQARRAGMELPVETTAGGHVDRYADPDLLAALRRLPDGQRAAVVLFYYADLPISQIAARLGSNGLAVRANLSRGRRRLRQLLGDDDA
jgi:RNA polymerase sigma-70 factor (ECF subfamily)